MIASTGSWPRPARILISFIAGLMNGTTHLAYKAEHAVDLESNLVVAGPNLGVLLRKLLGIGTPRSLQGAAAALCAWFFALVAWCHGVVTDWRCEVTCRRHPDHSLKAA